MPHSLNLVTTLAASLGLAMIFGYLATRLRMPPLVGYLLAGVLIGPATPGFVADVQLARELAEIGVLLLMFGVGLHFSLDDLVAVRKIAVPGAILQMAAATGFGTALSLLWGWPHGAAFMLGLTLSIASTVVVLRSLEARGALASIDAKIAVGWLIVEDLVTVLVLVLLPALAETLGGHAAGPTPGGLGVSLLLTLGKAALFVGFMILVGRRLLPWTLRLVAQTGSRELFTLCVISVAVGVAYGASALFDVSLALGAFFAGTMMSESELSQRAAAQSLPLRDAFAVLFFVSVGMLFDPQVVIEDPVKLLQILGIVMIGNPLVAMAVVVAFRYPLKTALVVGASLSQIGEFSFILAAIGVSLGLMPDQGQSVIVAAAMLSIAANPLLFAAIRPMHAWIRDRPRLVKWLERSGDRLAQLPMSTSERVLSDQIVLVGYGRVGRRIAQALVHHAIPFVVAEHNRELVESLRGQGIAAVSGDASDPAVLVQAHVASASMLVIATPDPIPIRRMVEIACTLNPTIEIAVRTHSEEEAHLLPNDLTVFFGEQELALAMTQHILARRGIETYSAPASRV